MSKKTLKSIAQRGVTLGAAFAVVAASFVQAVPAYADALNPLTERSLTLSSSSPGWSYTDGSGNTTYAPPNSGANGQKTGNYFSFKTSSAATVNTFSFQYCTTSAGSCTVPGDNVANGTDTGTTSDLNTAYGTSTPSDLEVDAGDFNTVIDSASGKVKAVPGYTNNNPKYQANGGTGDAAEAAKNVTGSYIVMYKSGGVWQPSSGWEIATQTVANARTATKNYITLSNSTGQAFTVDQEVKVLFFANGTSFITNPGSGAFFVKINTYDVTYDGTTVDKDDLAPATDANVIDGGVTVANVMNQSIQITTKVLETMEFSVGTVDPNTLSSAELNASDIGSATHIPCDRILTRMAATDTEQNVLRLGDQSTESALRTDKAYATHSYWRLSSNSSGGASVYYSGHTLSNTSGDEIDPIGATKAESRNGSEQFGLALATAALSGTPAGTVDPQAPAFNTGAYGVSYAQDGLYENAADNGKTGVHVSQVENMGATYTGAATRWDPTDADWTYPSNFNSSYHTPRLNPLIPQANYANGYGKINSDSTNVGVGNAEFAFDPMSDTVPALLATESTDVVDCVTAKMRYVANIAATTPAGIYTTKINYIAAPQY